MSDPFEGVHPRRQHLYSPAELKALLPVGAPDALNAALAEAEATHIGGQFLPSKRRAERETPGLG